MVKPALSDQRKSRARILADYLTDSSRVVSHSIALSMSGKRKVEADEFFVLREAFNVTGYIDAIEAENIIRDIVIT